MSGSDTGSGPELAPLLLAFPLTDCETSENSSHLFGFHLHHLERRSLARMISSTLSAATLNCVFGKSRLIFNSFPSHPKVVRRGHIRCLVVPQQHFLLSALLLLIGLQPFESCNRQSFFKWLAQILVSFSWVQEKKIRINCVAKKSQLGNSWLYFILWKQFNNSSYLVLHLLLLPLWREVILLVIEGSGLLFLVPDNNCPLIMQEYNFQQFIHSFTSRGIFLSSFSCKLGNHFYSNFM